MRPNAFDRRRLPALIAGLALAAAFPRDSHAYHLEDPLTGSIPEAHQAGGSYGASGWTVTATTDTIWYAIPNSPSSGSIEFTVSNVTNASLYFDPSWGGGDNDVFAMYDDNGIGEPIMYRPQFVGDNYRVWLRIRNEPGNWGTQKLDVGLCPSSDSAYHDGTCPCGTGFNGEATGGDGTWDGTPQRFRFEFGNGSVRFLRNGNLVDNVDYASDTNYQWGPVDFHFSLGNPRTRAVSSGMPIGAVFSDLVVDTVDGSPWTCMPAPPEDAGMPPVDAGPSCDATRAVTAVSLAPTAGSGSSQIFHAVYDDCLGASNFRIEQINVWDAVSGTVPVVGAGYEGGMLFNEAGSCVPGEARILTADYGGLDCSQSRVTVNGTQVAVDWALFFNANFVGTHGVWFDAKGFPDPGGPRLGWTQMGSFTVVAPDAGPPDSGVVDTGVVDTGVVDTGVADTGVVGMDSGVADAGSADSGRADAGSADAAAMDGARADTGNGGGDAAPDGGTTQRLNGCFCATPVGVPRAPGATGLAVLGAAIALGSARRRKRGGGYPRG